MVKDVIFETNLMGDIESREEKWEREEPVKQGKSGIDAGETCVMEKFDGGDDGC